MLFKYFDAHTHVNFPEFDADREAVIEKTLADGGGMINVGTDLETSRQVVWLAEKYPAGLWATVGVHPNDYGNFPTEAEWQELKTLAAKPKVVAIGECGLDYFRSDEASKETQKKLFQKQIELAHEAGKPLMLHVRNAYEDTLAVLTANKNLLLAERPGNVHFFAGDWDTAKKFLELGFTLSFTGVLTFTRDYDEVVKRAPLDMILAETDAPYAAPVPHRGRRNEPAYVQEVVKAIAVIRGEPLADISRAVVANAGRVFNLPPA